MSVQLPGIGVYGCFTEGECDWTEKMNDSLAALAVEAHGCVTGLADGTLVSDASAFTTPVVSDAYVDAAGCFCVYLGAAKGWVCNPPVCGRVVFDQTNKISYVWEGGTWKAITICQTIVSSSIDDKGASTYPSGTLAYNDSSTPWVEYQTIDGLWQSTGRIWDPATCEFTYLLTKEQVSDCLLFDVQSSATSATPPIGKLGIFSFGGTLYKIDDTGAIDSFVCDSVYQAGLLTIAANLQLVQDQIDSAVSVYTDATQAGLLVELDAAGLLDPCLVSKYPSVELAADWIAKYGAPAGGERRYVPSTGRVLVYDAVLGAWRDEAESVPQEVFLISEQQPNGIDGGDQAVNTWVPRVLNTVNATASYASAAGNQVTLQPGCCYLIEASTPTYNAGRSYARIWDATAGTEIAMGTSEWNNFQATGLAPAQTRSFVQTEFCPTVATTIELQQFIGASPGTRALGFQSDNAGSGVEVYSQMKILKLRDI